MSDKRNKYFIDFSSFAYYNLYKFLFKEYFLHFLKIKYSKLIM